MITAWQISQTLQKMEEFMRFIEQFDSERSRLEMMLPMIQRVKRVNEQKQYLSKQMEQLSKTILPINSLQQSSPKQSSLKQQQLKHSQLKQLKHYNNSNQRYQQYQIQQQKHTISQKYSSKLHKQQKQLIKYKRDITKEIEQIKRQIQQKARREQQQLAQKRYTLMRQLQNYIDEKVAIIDNKIVIDDKLQQQQKYQYNNRGGQQYQVKVYDKLQSYQVGVYDKLQSYQVRVYDKFIQQLIQRKIHSQILNDNQHREDNLNIGINPNANNNTNIRYNYNDYNNLSQLVDSQYNQFGQLHSLLSSNEDKTRKSIVNQLLTPNNYQSNINYIHSQNNKHNIHSQGKNKEINNRRQYINPIQQQQKPSLSTTINKHNRNNTDNMNDNSDKQQQQFGILKSILSIFTNKNESNNNNSNINNNNSNNNDQHQEHRQSIISNSNNPLSSSPLIRQSSTPNTIQLQQSPLYFNNISKLSNQLQSIPNNQVRLRVSQILSQIIQFYQHINTIVNINTINKSITIINHIHHINHQITSYQRQLFNAAQFIITSLPSTNHNQQNNLLTYIRQNKQVEFFLQFINSNIISRHKLLINILSNLLYSIPTIRKYVYKRLSQLQQTYLQFQSTYRINNNIKLKSIQSNKQYQILLLYLNKLKNYINNIIHRISLLQNKLIQGLILYIQGLKYIIEQVIVNMKNRQLQQISEYMERLQSIAIVLSNKEQVKQNNALTLQTIMNIKQLLQQPTLINKLIPLQQQLTTQSLISSICSQQQSIYNTSNTYINKYTNKYIDRLHNKLQQHYQTITNTILSALTQRSYIQ